MYRYNTIQSSHLYGYTYQLNGPQLGDPKGTIILLGSIPRVASI